MPLAEHMRIAVAQVASGTDPRENLELVREWVGRARHHRPDIVVFPEATMASFATRSASVAEPLDGEWAEEVRRIAAEAGVVVIVGMFTTAEGESRPRNTLLVTGPETEAAYHKMHMYDAWGFEESRHIAPGHEPLTIVVAGMRLGLATCYEVRFPEMFKYYASRGAQVVVLPASWANGPGKAEQWSALCRARALDSTCYVVACAQADPASVGFEVKPGAPTGVGRSVVVGPLGDVLAEAGDGPELLVVDLEGEAVGEARKKLPVLATSRFEVLPPRV